MVQDDSDGPVFPGFQNIPNEAAEKERTLPKNEQFL
jgi:hypothetical protein